MKKWKKIINADSVYLAIALAIVLRMGSFINIMADAEEWTYWQIATEWLQGERLYIDLIDIKPPGIFMVFVVLIKISFNQFWIAKIWSTLLLGVASWHAGIIGNRLFGIKRIWTAVFFLLAFNYHMGTAMNTELFYVSFVTIGGALLFSQYNPKRMIGAIFIGLAFTINYAVAVDVLVLGLLLLYSFRSRSIRDRAFLALQSVLLFLLVPAMVALMFYFYGYLGVLKEVVFELPGKYISEHSTRKIIDSFVQFHYRFIWLVILAYIGLITLFKTEKSKAWLFTLWITGAWAIISLYGPLHDHNWLHLALPLAIMAAVVISSVKIEAYRQYLYIPFAITIPLFAGLQLKKAFETNESIMSVAYSVPTMQVTDVLWSANGPAAYYTLLGKNCPIPFVHGSLVFEEAHCAVFDHTCESLWEQALDRSNLVIFTMGSDRDEEFIQLLEKDFLKLKQIKDTHSIWLKDRRR